MENREGFYASHVYNPYFYEGTKTYVYEIFEQLNGNMVDTLVIPVGNGTLLLGAYYGVRELLDLGLIEKMPRIIGGYRLKDVLLFIRLLKKKLWK